MLKNKKNKGGIYGIIKRNNFTKTNFLFRDCNFFLAHACQYFACPQAAAGKINFYGQKKNSAHLF